MRSLISYLDAIDLARKYDTDIQIGNPEELAEKLFLKTGKGFQPSFFIFYLLDFSRKTYIAVGPGYHTFLGYKADWLRDGGPLSYFDLWHKNDWSTYNTEVFADQSKTLKDLSPADKKNLLIKTSYRVKTKKDGYLTLAQQSSYIDVSDDGVPLAAIGIVSDITAYKTDTKMSYNIGIFDNTNPEAITQKTLLNKIYFPNKQDAILSAREIEVLKWICDGLTTKQIADKLYLSPYTVNNHRVNILEKTGAANFAEVLKYAIATGIL